MAVNRTVRALGLEAFGRVMKKTPVLTGRARGNWNPSTAFPDYSTNETATEAEAAEKLARAAAVLNEADFWTGEAFWIANGLDYIERLEDGHSKQAPAGMVKVTVEELKPLVTRLALQNRL